MSSRAGAPTLGHEGARGDASSPARASDGSDGLAIDMRTKRAYQPAHRVDGHRPDDHYWPRGIKRERARLDESTAML